MIRGDTGNIKSRSIYYELIQIAGTHFIHAQHCNKLAKKEHLHAAQVGTHTNIHPDSCGIQVAVTHHRHGLQLCGCGGPYNVNQRTVQQKEF